MSDIQFGFDVPEHLRCLTIRYEQHVAKLVLQFKAFGMTEDAIEQNVDQLIASYREELVQAIKECGDVVCG